MTRPSRSRDGTPAQAAGLAVLAMGLATAVLLATAASPAWAEVTAGRGWLTAGSAIATRAQASAPFATALPAAAGLAAPHAAEQGTPARVARDAAMRADPDEALPVTLRGSNRGQWAMRGALAMAGLLLAVWAFVRQAPANIVLAPGFEIITDSERRRFIALEDKYQQFDFITNIKTEGALRLSANLNKVTLSIRRFGYLMEDRNFRNALLVNRRRVRRTVLKDGDVLDLGDLTLLYRDNRIPPLKRHTPVSPPEGKVSIKFERPRGPVRRGTGMLIWGGQPPRTFYFTQNMLYVGRSESNDLIIKAQNIEFRHAKVEKIGNRYKLINLAPGGNTYVNNRRVDIRFLKEGDEVSFDNHKFKFALLAKPVRERQTPPQFHSQGPRRAAMEELAGDDDDLAVDDPPQGGEGDLHQSQPR
ncbi:MAG: FHA domain-containing protein [Candidatus Lambdaproteobacteria bacterium]|nr:FHA domain-containing protein [Candidatus Lambdaproteobacteria bacterium]